jgi:hypothetical protein
MPLASSPCSPSLALWLPNPSGHRDRQPKFGCLLGIRVALLGPGSEDWTVIAFILLPMFDARLTRLFGDAAMQHWCMHLTVGVAFELLLPTALFSLPPLLVALLGGWLAPRLWPVQGIASVGLGGETQCAGLPNHSLRRLRPAAASAKRIG